MLWIAGPNRADAVDDYDWERLRGGGFALLNPADGRPVACGLLPDDVAWGTGGVPVAPWGRLLVAAGRTGRVHVVDPGDLDTSRATVPLAGVSLGIGHLTVVGRQVVWGFNRGGYRLHAVAQSRDAEGR
jgi:hypothetical protein